MHIFKPKSPLLYLSLAIVLLADRKTFAKKQTLDAGDLNNDDEFELESPKTTTEGSGSQLSYRDQGYADDEENYDDNDVPIDDDYTDGYDGGQYPDDPVDGVDNGRKFKEGSGDDGTLQSTIDDDEGGDDPTDSSIDEPAVSVDTFEVDINSSNSDIETTKAPIVPEIEEPSTDSTSPSPPTEPQQNDSWSSWMNSFWGEKWFLAALLGGATVGFIIIIIVIIVICHAVRKKDEGSYIIEKKYSSDTRYQGGDVQQNNSQNEYFA